MMKPGRAIGQKPVVPPRRRSLLYMRSISKTATFNFPDSHHLIITTSKGVFIWDREGILPVFQSETGGIVASRKTANDSELLAVADSQVVLLHDMNRGDKKTYKLRGSDGHVRVLQYAQDTDCLFFTTTLQNSVQAYSLEHSKLLSHFHNHPSPPTVLALSIHSYWLLSASVAPPTILLSNLMLNTPAIFIRPQCSLSAVVAANFHPHRTNFLVLAFADGACAMYDVASVVRFSERHDHQANPADSRTGGEISHIKRLHAIAGSIPALDSQVGFQGPDSEYMNCEFGATSIGITAVAFVPGSRAKAVTIGADGKCCVIEFMTEGKKRGSLLRSWHIQGPATSLALSSSTSKSTADDIGGDAGKTLKQSRRRFLVAIGRQDGMVLLYDLSGHLLRSHDVGMDGSKIIELEWTSTPDLSDSDLTVPLVFPLEQSKQIGDEADAKSTISTSTYRKTAHDLAHPSHIASPALTHRNSTIETSKNFQAENYSAPFVSDGTNTGKLKDSSPSHRRLFPTVRAGVDGPLAAASSGPLASKNIQVSSLPPFSPLLARRRGGVPLIFSTKKVRQPSLLGTNVDSRTDMQRGHSSNASASIEVAQLTPSGKTGGIAQSHAASTHGKEAVQVAPNEEEALLSTLSDDGDWTDVATSSRRPIRKLHEKPARVEKRKDRRTHLAPQPSSSLGSEASDDMVFDFPRTSDRLAPADSLLPLSLPEIPPRMKGRKKGRPSSLISNDTVVQWSSFKRGHIFAMQANTSNPKLHTSPSSITSKKKLSTTTTKREILADTSHNPIRLGFAETPSAPSRAPPPPPFDVSSKLGEHKDAKSRIEAKFKTLRDEVEVHFQEQKTWLDSKLQDLCEESRRINEENRRLRSELKQAKAASKTGGLVK